MPVVVPPSSAATSAKQTVATQQVFDYIYDTSGKPVVGSQVIVTLNFNGANDLSPVVAMGPIQQQTVTDNNGYWTFNLVPNASLTPSGTTYNVHTPFSNYDISVPASGGAFQSSQILVNTPAVLSPAVTGLVGPITVTGDETVTGNLTVQGTTTLAPLTAAGVNTFSGVSTFLARAQFKNADPWFDVRAYGAVGDGVTNDATAIGNAVTAADAAGGGAVFFPPGVYLVTSSVSVPQTVSLFGVGKQSIIKGAAAPLVSLTNVSGVNANTTNAQHVCDLHFQVTSNNTALALTGVQNATSLTPAAVLRGLHFNALGNAGATATLLTLTSCQYVLIHACSFVSQNNGTVGTSNGITFSGCSNCQVSEVAMQLMLTGVTFQNDAVPHITQGCFLTNVMINGATNGLISSNTNNCQLVNCMIDNVNNCVNSTTDSGLAILHSYIGSRQTGDALHFFNSPVSTVLGCHIQLYNTGNAAVNMDGNAAVNNCIVSDNSVGGSAPVNLVKLNFPANFLAVGNNFAAVPSGAKVAITNQQGNNILFSRNGSYNPVGAVTPPAAQPVSGTTYTNTFPHYIRISSWGGTVTNISINGSGVATQGNWSGYLAPGDQIVYTHTGLPGWVWLGD